MTIKVPTLAVPASPVAVAVIDPTKEPEVVGVPVMAPVLALMIKPGGSPVAVQVEAGVAAQEV